VSANTNGNKWSANISYGGKQHCLGSFNTKEEAAAAYDEAARKYRPDLPLNFSSAEAAASAVAEAVSEWEQQQSTLQPKPRAKPRAKSQPKENVKVATFPPDHIVNTLLHTAQSANGSSSSAAISVSKMQEEEILDDFSILADVAPITATEVTTFHPQRKRKRKSFGDESDGEENRPSRSGRATASPTKQITLQDQQEELLELQQKLRKLQQNLKKQKRKEPTSRAWVQCEKCGVWRRLEAGTEAWNGAFVCESNIWDSYRKCGMRQEKLGADESEGEAMDEVGAKQ
jgi:hypothetical protein